MSHRWTVGDGAWLSDGGWYCAACQRAAMFWIDTRDAGPCPTRPWPWTTVRIARFKAHIRALARTP